jgi:hypothetical protein
VTVRASAARPADVAQLALRLGSRPINFRRVPC